MPSQKNIDQLAEIKEKFAKSKNAIIATYAGLKVSDQVELRAKIKEAGGELNVSKNTLVRLAMEERVSLSDEDKKALEGPNAIMYGFEDAVSATKAIVEFADDNDNVEIKLGFMAGGEGAADKVLSVDQVTALSKLPSKDELRAKVVGTIAAPLTGFVNVMAGNLRGLVNVLNAVKDQKAQ